MRNNRAEWQKARRRGMRWGCRRQGAGRETSKSFHPPKNNERPQKDKQGNTREVSRGGI